uniref:Lysine--tRNA ligase, cytoplasmic-like n=1 Tax=Nicotiana tabacum TaxID=4097 RepID=A0A1S3XKQ6_TOBAC|nr:PREDICTED: lysine--tRNA ligase, cytoplasmic-like [Nicotiana tabacum]
MENQENKAKSKNKGKSEKKGKSENKPSTQSQKHVAAGDKDTDPTQYFENRQKPLEAKKATEKNPYPHKFEHKVELLSIPDYVKLNGAALNYSSEKLNRVALNYSTNDKELYLFGNGSCYMAALFVAKGICDKN